MQSQLGQILYCNIKNSLHHSAYNILLHQPEKNWKLADATSFAAKLNQPCVGVSRSQESDHTGACD